MSTAPHEFSSVTLNLSQVLIVYVMNPPVKDAIQGAYVLAATVTGLFFGAVAVIFPEVTEKLGCLLGGFCLSMWCKTASRVSTPMELTILHSSCPEARWSHN